MNYQKLSANGFKYLLAAADNWHLRQQKIMQAHSAKNYKAFKLYSELEDRKLEVGKLISQHKEKMKWQQIEADHQQVMLSCPSLECRLSPVGIGVSVYLKDYEPDKHFCKTCGTELQIFESIRLFNELGLHS